CPASDDADEVEVVAEDLVLQRGHAACADVELLTVGNHEHRGLARVEWLAELVVERKCSVGGVLVVERHLDDTPGRWPGVDLSGKSSCEGAENQGDQYKCVGRAPRLHGSVRRTDLTAGRLALA